MTSLVVIPILVLALIGAAQALLAARALRRLVAALPPRGPAVPASLLKPLHGAEPGLKRNLRASLAQDHAAPFEVLFGMADPADAARPIAEAVAAAGPARVLTGGPVLGTNRKVSQLVHLAAAAQYPALVIADADMRCPPDWLTAVTAPLADPTIGLVTCLYRGEAADGGTWSRLAALGIDWHFLPNAALGERLGRAEGCYGATIALTRATLERIGGFAPLLPLLADDHAMGAAVRRLGLRVIVSPVIPVHVMAERSLRDLWLHELRWARTVRLLNPAGFLGLGLTHPLAWALLAVLLAPGTPSLIVLATVMAARLHLARQVDGALGVTGGWRRWGWLPARDLLSATVWAAALVRGKVVWQGQRYAVNQQGEMRESP